MTWPPKGPLVTPEKPVFPPSAQPVKSPVSKLPFVTRFVPAWAPKAAIVSDTTQAAVKYAFFIPLLPTLTEDLGPRVLPQYKGYTRSEVCANRKWRVHAEFSHNLNNKRGRRQEDGLRIFARELLRRRGKIPALPTRKARP